MRRLLGAVMALGGLACATAAGAVAPAHKHLERAPLLDTRKATTPAPPARVARARSAFVKRLGPQAFLSLDPVTGGVRFLGRTNGYLSAPARGDARTVALRWVRDHLDVLGLAKRDLAGLKLVHRYTSPIGVTRLIFQQTYRGIPAFDNSLRINVARDGRVVNVGGSPRSGLAGETTPGLTPIQAVLAAAAGVNAPALPALRVIGGPAGPRQVTHFRGRHHARLTLVSTGPRSTRLAWRVWFEQSSEAVWSVLVDARSGALIRRANQVKWATGLAWDYYPGAPRGGTARTVDLSPWLTVPDKLRGNFTHVYNDADGSEDFTTDTADPTQESMGDIVTPGEDIPPDGVTSGDWLYEYMPVPSPAGNCPTAGCAWNHLVNGSWVPNRNQDGTQVFFFVNRFSEHLKAAPIFFTEAAGNFQFENTTGQGKGNDGIYASNMDAAGQAGGRPIPIFWSDNANMLTRPDGQSPRMQMFLFEPIHGPDATGLNYPFSDVSGGSDGGIVYHEFTHGLSNRLIIDADGEGALNAAQSGAMGEAWSDFYAMDFMMKQGFETDTEKPGEIKIGLFVDGGQDLVRTEAIDCTLGAPKEACPRRRSPLAEEGGGGYTYEHFARIAGGAQVHADGEIWGQTLMDLRRRLVRDHGDAKGADRIESYVTRAMELSPEEPSFIDMRNAILQADLLQGGRDVRRIWEAFAARGMGAGANAVDGRDTAPTAAFDLPADLPAADMLGPAVTIDAPGENGVVRSKSARFLGTALDDAGVKSLTVNGQPVALDGSNWAARLSLPAGRQTVTVVARDIEGREGTATRTVRVDVRKPRFSGVRAVRRARRLHVTGRVLDDTSISRLTVGGRRVGVSRSGRFFAAVRRRPVKLVAVDRAGRRRTTTLK